MNDSNDDASRQWTKFGRYALLDKIGSGGMAEIYRAKTFGAAGFEKEYAIKLITPELVDDTEFVEMFINEAKIGEIEEQYYIAMEYVHGKDLLDILARCAKLNIKIPLNLVLFITMEMLKGLNFAHRAKDPYGEDLNIIHRDVSPSNILISYAGDVKVGDFGVAKAKIQHGLDSDSDDDTLKGKVGYMSPEQVMGEDIDSRSDIFSAGIVFFEALSMTRLFTGDSDLDVMLKVRDVEIEDDLDRAGPLPSDLKRIVRRALTKHREDRFQTAEDFYQALVDFCYTHSIKVTGNDLSNLMRRLFAEEIEEEKSKRRFDPETPSPESSHEGPGNAPEVPPSPEPPEEDEREERQTPEMQPSAEANMQSTAQYEDPSMASDAEREPNGLAGDTEATDDAESTTPPNLEVPSSAGVLGDSDTTPADLEESEYRLRAADGAIYGPMNYEAIVDLLHNRSFEPSAQVAVDEDDWHPISEVPELSDALEDDVLPDASAPSEPAAGAQVFRRASTPDFDGEETERNAVDDEPSTWESGDPKEALAEDTRADRNLEATVQAMEEISSAASQSHLADDDTEGDDGPPGAATFREPESSDQRDDELSTSQMSSESLRALSTAPEEIESIHQFKNRYASYEGELEEAPFPRLFGRLYFARSTGRLHLKRDEVEKSVYFRDGKPILVDSNKEEELLGSFLLSRDFITENQLEQALDRLHEWGVRLGDALVAIGARPAHDIYELLSEQMREKLLDIFTWQTGYYGYYENQEPDTKGYPLGVDALELIVEGCKEYVPFGYLVDFYDSRMGIDVHHADEAPIDPDRLQLSTHELRIYNEIAAGTTFQTLLDRLSSFRKSRIYRIVYLLEQLGMIDFEDDSTEVLSEIEESN